MVATKDFQKSRPQDILVTLVVSGLGLYLALAVSNTVTATVDRYIPAGEDDDDLRRNWISLAIAIIIVTIVVYALVKYYHKDE
jgi:uncharacterized membrane protein YdbT with pleckstrin-like domain